VSCLSPYVRESSHHQQLVSWIVSIYNNQPWLKMFWGVRYEVYRHRSSPICQLNCINNNQ
jgi:hypothetical protein